ncbi:hypothetical protein CSA08_02090 [Candidatus Gracilibacteria bacterium]|nr:MAG: hypothetical protein CSA08_02090 [Candidatus Gracilibacteria bacterium]
MKKQILFIHGGECFNTYEKYLDFLKNKMSADPFYEREKSWRDDIGDKLGDDYIFVKPTMPNKYNSKYSEWKIWFEKTLEFLDKKFILVGYSLGGTFLAKYLGENIINKKIMGLFLVAPAFSEKLEDLGDFKFKINPQNIEKQTENIHIYHSEDDKVVSFSDFLEFQTNLKSAKCKIFKNRGHFLLEEFPEIIEDIKNI